MAFENMILKMVTTDSPGDAGNEEGEKNFENDYVPALVREELQNALDNKSKHSDIVRVDFNTFQIDTRSLPVIDDWMNYARQNYYYWKGKLQYNMLMQDKAHDALMSLKPGKINCLRISDHGTTGLCGVNDDGTSSPYFNLVLNTNISDKPTGSAGSKGIGKNVAFATSIPKCVYYSSIAEPSKYSDVPEKCFIGNLHTSSFRHEGINFTGSGFFCLNDGEKTARTVSPVQECISLDPSFKREDGDYGTDVFIVGFADDSKKRKLPSQDDLILPILQNFLFAFFSGMLEVTIDGSVCINKETISAYMERYKEKLIQNYKSKTTVEYYETLCSPDKHFVFSSGIEENDCEAYVKLDPDFSNTALICRNIGMKIREKNRFRVSTAFSAVVYVKGLPANDYMRNLEDTSHANIKEKNDDQNIMSTIFNEIKRAVNDLFSETYTEQVEADGLSNYLPLNYVAGNDEHGDLSRVKEGLSMRIISVEEKETYVPKPTRTLSRDDKYPFYEDNHGHTNELSSHANRAKKRKSFHEAITDDGTDKESDKRDDSETGKSKNTGKTQTGNDEQTVISDSGDDTKMSKGKSTVSSLKSVNADQFVTKLLVKNGKYVVSIISKRKMKDCRIGIYLSADPTPVEAQIENVCVDGKPEKTKDNQIFMGSFEYGQEHIAEFNLRSKGLRTFEIKYQEALQ